MAAASGHCIVLFAGASKPLSAYDQAAEARTTDPDSEKHGPIYSTRTRFQRATMLVEGKAMHVTAGMAVTVEVKTSKRRVIEYFLNLRLKHGSESLRER